MSDMYAIKTSTLTALGDAVRSKTSKYIYKDTPWEEPIYSIDYDSRNYNIANDWQYSSSNSGYHTTIDIPLKELLGDTLSMYNVLGVIGRPKFLINFTYESNMEKSLIWEFAVTPRSGGVWYDRYVSQSSTFLTRELIDRLVEPSNNGREFTENYYISMDVLKSSIEKGYWFKFHFDIKVLTPDNKYVYLNTYTPLEMADAINGLNTESGLKLPWLVQRTDVPNFTITAEDIAGVSKIGMNAFYNSQTLTAVELPDTVQMIETRGFYNTDISEITFPVKLKQLDIGAFDSCSNLKTVRILNDTSVITAPTGNYNDPFSSCLKLTSIYIPSKLYNAYCADAYWSQHKGKFIPVGEWAFDPMINSVLLFNQTKEVSIQLASFANTPEFSITSSNEEVATISNVSINEDNTLLTYTINSLAIEGSATITVNIVGENNSFNFTNNVSVYETIPEPTYEIIPQVEGATYGFALREDGYWESQNFKKGGSTAVCQVNISNLKGAPVYFDCINYAEANYDYCLLGAVKQILSKTNADDSGVKKNFKGLSKADIQTVEYTDATGDCFIQVKFRKDSSGDQNNDSVRFKVRFGEV